MRRLFGVPIDALTMDGVLTLVDEAIARRQRLLIGVVNAAKLVNMRRDAALGDSVLGSDLIVADGMSVVWACRILGRPLPQRVAGIDLMQRMLGRANERRYRVFCLGATEQVLDETMATIARDYPSAVLAGHHHGYFTEQDEPRIAEAIRASRSDMLFVGMTSPRKEQFLARWMADMDVPVCHGVGGSFDVMAGKVKRAPRLWQQLGMEWLYRVVQEPRRMWKRYLVTNARFVWLVVLEFQGSGFRVPAKRRAGRQGSGNGGRRAEGSERPFTEP